MNPSDPLQKKTKKENGFVFKNPFLAPAAFLTDRLLRRKISEKQQLLDEEIRALHFGRPEAAREYHIKKTADILLLCCVLLAAAAVLIPVLYKSARPVPEEGLKRSGYKESPSQETLLASVEGESEEELLTVDLHQRTYTKDQAKALLTQARSEFEDTFLAENTSQNEVRSDLAFPSGLQEGLVHAEYLTIPYGVISEADGSVTLPEEGSGEVVEIQVTLTCQEETLVYETAVMVLPPKLSPAEQLWKELNGDLKKTEEATRNAEYFRLPENILGKKVTWRYPSSGDVTILLLMLLLLPVFLSIHRDEQIRSKAAARRQQLKLDYSDLVWKLTMLLNAGLTIRTALTRIAAVYESARTSGQTKSRYVYEEILYTCRELQSGVSEPAACLNLGRRCALPEYIKLSTLLEQNLKKGSPGLAQTLENEAMLSLEERISTARKEGEQAGTKLLFPMVLMLGVVLAVLMVPAVIMIQ